MEKLLETPPRDREGNVARAAMMARLVGSPGYPIPEEEVRERAGFAYDRAFHPEGATRQLAAIITHGSRVDALRKVRTPTLVIHGLKDERVHPEQGLELYQALKIKGVDTELVFYPREPHGLRERAHQLDYIERLVGWYNKYVK